jgi:hypothetical protein
MNHHDMVTMMWSRHRDEFYIRASKLDAGTPPFMMYGRQIYPPAVKNAFQAGKVRSPLPIECLSMMYLISIEAL